MLILPINDRHDRIKFDCGDEDLNCWLKHTARQHKEKGISSTFVSVANETTSSEILGFYVINLAELVNANLPAIQGALASQGSRFSAWATGNSTRSSRKRSW